VHGTPCVSAFFLPASRRVESGSTDARRATEEPALKRVEQEIGPMSSGPSIADTSSVRRQYWALRRVRDTRVAPLQSAL
jgi:hypothetical protein